MARSRVQIPSYVQEPFEVYVSGVPQRPGEDFEIEDGALVFDRVLRKDKVSGWRWFLGAWGVGTYRQDDSVDIRYERDGRTRVAEALEIEVVEDDA